MACLCPAFHELTVRKEVSAASMSRASASPWPNALNDADANIVQKHLSEIKRDANWSVNYKMTGKALGSRCAAGTCPCSLLGLTP